MVIDLSGKSFLVTGAGSGIGAACSRALASAGAFVWVNDLNASAAAELASEISGSAVAGDVSNSRAWVEPIVNSGVLQGIVHNAGYDLSTPVGKTNVDDFERAVRVMVTGPFDLTQALLPALRAAHGSAIVFISSVHSLTTESNTSAYAGAKGAINAMVRSMCQDLGGDEIRVVAVSPGYIDTPLLRSWLESTPDPAETRRHSESLHPLGRIGMPEDIAALVTFLLSPLAGFINGTNVVIDGGLTAQLPGRSE